MSRTRCRCRDLRTITVKRKVFVWVTGRLQVGVLFAIGAGRQAGDPFEKFAEHRL